MAPHRRKGGADGPTLGGADGPTSTGKGGAAATTHQKSPVSLAIMGWLSDSAMSRAVAAKVALGVDEPGDSEMNILPARRAAMCRSKQHLGH